MEPHDLLDMFIDTLSQKIDKKSDLVNFIVDSLNIEKESVYRRLNKKVSFSISEMGILASKLGISIDGMLKYQKKYTSPRAYTLSLPKSIHSIDTLINWIEDDVKILHDISKEPVEFETTFHDLPLEFVIPYNNLLKFSYFKWAYYYLKSNDYRDFSSWQMPPKLISAGNMIIDEYTKWNSITYLWDVSTIWCLVKDITYFSSIRLLEPEDVEAIKMDVHKLLYGMEKVAEGIPVHYFNPDKMNIYISTVNMGTQFAYFLSENKCYSYFYTHFIGSNYMDDYKTCIQIRNWVNAMKKMCTLISHSGAKERKLFFDEQHQIVDNCV